MNKKDIFENIYDKGIWSEGRTKPLSGPGSTPEIAKGCIEFINKGTTEKRVLTALDLGCGDLTWITKCAHWQWLKYTGVDIAQSVIDENKKKYGGADKSFFCDDVLDFTKQLGHYDLIIVRDICFHMKTNEVLELLENIKGKYTYLMITSCNIPENIGEPDGHYYFRPLNLCAAPFNIPVTQSIPEPQFNRTVLISKGSIIIQEPTERIVWAYWTGDKPSLITILHELMEKFAKKGKGYTLNLLTRETCEQYVAVQKGFDRLCPAHQADYLRVSLVCKYGGIWLDSDTLVMESLDNLFDIMEYSSGFFIQESGAYPGNGVFGSIPGTPLMKRWKQVVDEISQKPNIAWTEMGNAALSKLKQEGLMSDYHIFSGYGDMYPVNYDKAILFIDKEYNYANLWRRPFQPLIVLVNEVYKKLAHLTPEQIKKKRMALNWFLDKAYRN